MAAKRKAKTKPKRSASDIAMAMLGGGAKTTAPKAAATSTPKQTVAKQSVAKQSVAKQSVAKQSVAKPTTATANSQEPAKPAKARQPATHSIADVLEAARAAVAKADFTTGLSLLLDAWRAVPASSIANAIDRVGASAHATLTPPSGKTPKERNDAWNKAARTGDPAMRGLLVQSLTETKGAAETLARIELLVKYRDPRVASRIVDLVETPVYNASVHRTSAFWKRMFALLPELGDPRILERQRGFHDAWEKNSELNPPERPAMQKRLAVALPGLEHAYGDGVPALSRDDEARCAAVIAAIGKAVAPDRDDAALLAEIYAAPDDDHVRMVYADWLQERGDPRGEFIALQLARAGGARPTKEQTQREKDLIAEFGTRWLGPLAKATVKKGLRFERGFLATCELAGGCEVDASPEWATVREIDGGVPISDECHVPSLRVLSNVRDRHIEVLAKLTRPLAVEEMSWDGPYADEEQEPLRTITAFGKIRVLPKLRSLAVSGWTDEPISVSRMAWVWQAPAAANLETLQLGFNTRDLATYIAALSATKIQKLLIRYGWHFELERDPENKLSRMTVIATRWSTYDEQMIKGVAALPANTLTFARVAISPDIKEENYKKLRKALVAVFARQKRLATPAVIEQATS